MARHVRVFLNHEGTQFESLSVQSRYRAWSFPAASLDATVHALSVVDDTSLDLDVRSTVSGGNGEQVATDAVDDTVPEVETHSVTNIVRHIEHGTPIEDILERSNRVTSTPS